MRNFLVVCAVTLFSLFSSFATSAQTLEIIPSNIMAQFEAMNQQTANEAAKSVDFSDYSRLSSFNKNTKITWLIPTETQSPAFNGQTISSEDIQKIKASAKKYMLARAQRIANQPKVNVPSEKQMAKIIATELAAAYAKERKAHHVPAVIETADAE